MFTLCLSAILISFGAVLMAMPVCLYFSQRFNVYDIPDGRKVHTHPIPRWGGCAIAVGFFAAIYFLWLTARRFGWLLAYRQSILNEAGDIIGYVSLEKQLIGILIGGAVVLILGMWDDRSSISPGPKLLIQIIASYIAIDYGVRISGIRLPFGEHYWAFPLIISQFVTVIWLIGFMNMINLIDGLDGLAAGIVAIVAGTFMILALMQGETKIILFSKQLKLASIISAGVLGASLGFLMYNFYPAKIFMGDGGTLLLGFLLGATTVIGTLKTAAVMAFVVPVIVVGLPVLDVALAVTRRLRQGRHIFKPDKEHIHHMLLKAGWTQREIVLLMYVITLLLSIGALLITIFK